VLPQKREKPRHEGGADEQTARAPRGRASPVSVDGDAGQISSNHVYALRDRAQLAGRSRQDPNVVPRPQDFRQDDLADLAGRSEDGDLLNGGAQSRNGPAAGLSCP
jgi:hypothetical protein